jgi:hypothetical protein
MSYIGNTNTTQAFTPAVDFFSGNASTTAFTLSRPVASVAQVQAVISNVPQDPGSAYTVSGNTITFTSAPPSGTNNIYVSYTSPITQVIAPGQGTVTTTSLVTNFTLPVANGGTAATSASAARTSLGLVIGTDVLAPNGSGASLTSLNATNISSGTLAKARLPTGGVLQVLQGFKTDTFSTTSTSLQDVSGLSVAITPTSSSSKFLIMVNLTYLNTLFVGPVALLRNGTQIGLADAAGSRPIAFLYYSNSTNGSTDGQWVRESMDYLDSPATASAITYKIQASARADGQGGTMYINRSLADRNTVSYDARGVSSIVVMEIAG